MKNAQLIDTFTARAAEYQRNLRTVAQELRDLRALEHAQTYIADRTGRENEQLADAICLLEECIVANLGLYHCHD
jgi:hypothetical protein